MKITTFFLIGEPFVGSSQMVHFVEIFLKQRDLSFIKGYLMSISIVEILGIWLKHAMVSDVYSPTQRIFPNLTSFKYLLENTRHWGTFNILDIFG